MAPYPSVPHGHSRRSSSCICWRFCLDVTGFDSRRLHHLLARLRPTFRRHQGPPPRHRPLGGGRAVRWQRPSPPGSGACTGCGPGECVVPFKLLDGLGRCPSMAVRPGTPRLQD
jgi:hypothetical protein